MVRYEGTLHDFPTVVKLLDIHVASASQVTCRDTSPRQTVLYGPGVE